ncbi:MAG: nickel pincer cofactor biosynthesis protein LarB [Tepidibacter sp.]|jgi:NCAIR mutase (PurE)-related protein|uniref:nickel pincer cofactor biosynthesis protein LarB n=1 Tax=Tepidibacter sp. TaxID=2529387 RepID=UPI0025D203AB|nr:nickel pincer cofactor biosynthesis protein LarB [Tepidibacter sp.]MCT4507462.1 nickel pincer cofactor biosynthesis protein LarB [Tepidibacter sp.]
MDINNLKNLLLNIKEGKVDVDTALEDLKTLPFEDLGYAKVDHHRSIRNGYPEVIYCEGKTDEHIIGIVEKMYEKKSNILGTRAKKETYEKLKKIYPNCEYEELGRIIKIQNKPIENIGKGSIVVVTGGTSDIPVADEAYHTAKFLGNDVKRLYDVGVAGIHRLLNNKDVLMDARVIIAVAGMEGALPSVVGGLVDVPVIAVPTSVGYGANFNGLSALLTMLNSCASGISVVNIDNGFGAGYLSSMINKL